MRIAPSQAGYFEGYDFSATPLAPGATVTLVVADVGAGAPDVGLRGRRRARRPRSSPSPTRSRHVPRPTVTITAPRRTARAVGRCVGRRDDGGDAIANRVVTAGSHAGRRARPRRPRHRLRRHRHQPAVRLPGVLRARRSRRSPRPTPTASASIVFWALIVIISIKYLLLVMRADNHGEGGILALTALLMPNTRPAAGPQAHRHRAGRVRHRPALRRRPDHAGDLGAVGGRGLRGGDQRLRAMGHPGVDRHPRRRCSSCSGGAPRRSPASSGRSWCSGSSCIAILGLRQILDHPRCSGRSHRATACSSSSTSRRRRSSPSARSSSSSPAARRSTPTWVTSGARPIQLSWYSLVLPALVLNYFGQAALLASHPGERGRQAVLPHGAGVGRHPARRAGHDGDGHRLPGVDLRRVLAHRAGRAARLPAAPRHPPHVGGPHRPDLRAARQLAADVRLRRSRARLPHARATSPPPTASPSPPRWPSRRCSSTASSSTAGSGSRTQGAGRHGAAARHRPRLPRRQHPEDPPRRLVPARRRASASSSR